MKRVLGIEGDRRANINSPQIQALWVLLCWSCRSMHGRYATRSELWTWAAVIERMRCRTRDALGKTPCPSTDPIFVIGRLHRQRT
jgi:hypothetical protein